MASDYRAASGYGVALGSLVAINPQPSSGGIKATQRTYGTSGKAHEMGEYAELVWSVVETPTQYASILSQFGLTSVLENQVTVYIRNSAFAYARYNAIAVRPQLGVDGNWDNYFLRGVVIVLRNLVAL